MNIPHNDLNIYAGSCNPSRRAKRPPSESLADSSPPSPRPCDQSGLPYPANHPFSRTYTHASDNNNTAINPTVMPSKLPPAALGTPNPASTPSLMTATTIMNDPPTQRRGRKTTSRAAREAQRKLNHSMIEKVRRTRINEALATLKSLVPVDYGRTQPPPQDEDGGHESGGAGNRDDDGDETDEQRTSRKKTAKGPSKKDERERDYKLEILIRTVGYLQDLVEKVKVLEAVQGTVVDVRVCTRCGRDGNASVSNESSASSSSDKRKKKRSRDSDDDHDDYDGERTQRRGVKRSSDVGRLPSISSWLPLTPFTGSIHHLPTPSSGFHLPSPPSSTLVDPVKSTLHPPPLSLELPPAYKLSPTNPFQRQRLSLVTQTDSSPYVPGSPQRTPDDESAASLLLQISNSPISRPVYPRSGSPASLSFDLPKVMTLASEGKPGSSAGRRPPPLTPFRSPLQAQTPSSLLGLDCSTHRPRHS